MSLWYVYELRFFIESVSHNFLGNRGILSLRPNKEIVLRSGRRFFLYLFLVFLKYCLFCDRWVSLIVDEVLKFFLLFFKKLVYVAFYLHCFLLLRLDILGPDLSVLFEHICKFLLFDLQATQVVSFRLCKETTLILVALQIIFHHLS